MGTAYAYRDACQRQAGLLLVGGGVGGGRKRYLYLVDFGRFPGENHTFHEKFEPCEKHENVVHRLCSQCYYFG